MGDNEEVALNAMKIAIRVHSNFCAKKYSKASRKVLSLTLKPNVL
jgi:hypothetical protein